MAQKILNSDNVVIPINNLSNPEVFSEFATIAGVFIQSIEKIENTVLDDIYLQLTKKIECLSIGILKNVTCEEFFDYSIHSENIKSSVSNLKSFMLNYNKMIEDLKMTKEIPKGKEELLTNIMESIFENKVIQFFAFFNVFANDKNEITEQMFDTAKHEKLDLPESPGKDNFFDKLISNHENFLLNCKEMLNKAGKYEEQHLIENKFCQKINEYRKHQYNELTKYNNEKNNGKLNDKNIEFWYIRKNIMIKDVQKFQNFIFSLLEMAKQVENENPDFFVNAIKKIIKELKSEYSIKYRNLRSNLLKLQSKTKEYNFAQLSNLHLWFIDNNTDNDNHSRINSINDETIICNFENLLNFDYLIYNELINKVKKLQKEKNTTKIDYIIYQKTRKMLINDHKFSLTCNNNNEKFLKFNFSISEICEESNKNKFNQYDNLTFNELYEKLFTTFTNLLIFNNENMQAEVKLLFTNLQLSNDTLDKISHKDSNQTDLKNYINIKMDHLNCSLKFNNKLCDLKASLFKLEKLLISIFNNNLNNFFLSHNNGKPNYHEEFYEMYVQKLNHEITKHKTFLKENLAIIFSRRKNFFNELIKNIQEYKYGIKSAVLIQKNIINIILLALFLEERCESAKNLIIYIKKIYQKYKHSVNVKECQNLFFEFINNHPIKIGNEFNKLEDYNIECIFFLTSFDVYINFDNDYFYLSTPEKYQEIIKNENLKIKPKENKKSNIKNPRNKRSLIIIVICFVVYIATAIWFFYELYKAGKNAEN
ncbi:hypothetical protein GVAV_000630 [Gurleya vavrai]